MSLVEQLSDRRLLVATRIVVIVNDLRMMNDNLENVSGVIGEALRLLALLVNSQPALGHACWWWKML